MTDNRKIRIRLYGQHLGYINNNLYAYFLRNCNVLDYSSWIKKKTHAEFNLYIDSKESIDKLKEIVLRNHYEDVADWLREKMREDMRNVEPK